MPRAALTGGSTPMWIGKKMVWWGDHNESPEDCFIIQGQERPEHDLWVIGAALSMRYVNMPPDKIAASWAMAGIAGSRGDYLCRCFPHRETQTMFPAGYAVRLPWGHHAQSFDFHVYCPQVEHGLFFGHLTIWVRPAKILIMERVGTFDEHLRAPASSDLTEQS